jgi:hypothetical protein
VPTGNLNNCLSKSIETCSVVSAGVDATASFTVKLNLPWKRHKTHNLNALKLASLIKHDSAVPLALYLIPVLHDRIMTVVLCSVQLDCCH